MGNNADLYAVYAANQESKDLINETYMDEVPLRFIFMGQDVSHQQPRSISISISISID